jgi:hypothetical protein
MKCRILAQRIAVAVLCGSAFAAQAAIVWDEAASGDLSGNGLSPTILPFAAGSNTVLGTTGVPGNGSGGVDRDYFSFVVPTGMTLDSIILRPETNVIGGVSFAAMQVGPQVTVDPVNGSPIANLLWYGHYDTSLVGSNILAYLGPGALPAGTYSMWVQDTGGGSTDYGFDFNVAPVPLPGAAGLMISGLAALGALRRRRVAARQD